MLNLSTYHMHLDFGNVKNVETMQVLEWESYACVRL